MTFDLKISSLVDIKKVQGRLYGVEIEMEGAHGFPPVGAELNFKGMPDNSLRPGGIEYVSLLPKSKEDLKQDIGKLHKLLVAHNTLPVDSPRAGVHIHINFQDNTFLALLNFLTLYYILENSLIRNCGKGRIGNLFCLRMEDAMYIKSNLLRAVMDKDIFALNSKGVYRYSAMNTDSLFSYGTLEFRALRTPTDIRAIGIWFDVFDQLQDAAKEFKTPNEIVEKVSLLGHTDFVKKVMGKYNDFINPLYLADDIQTGIWNIQSFAYATNWTGK
jgi:hypothetical protein